MPVPKMIETIQETGGGYKIKWMLPDGTWNQIAFMTNSLEVAEGLVAGLKAGLYDLNTGDLLSEGVVSNIDPCPATNVL